MDREKVQIKYKDKDIYPIVRFKDVFVELKDGKNVDLNEALKEARVDSDIPIRVYVSEEEPLPEDGMVYFNSIKNNYYIAKNGKWEELPLSDTGKSERYPPKNPPILDYKTNDTIVLIPNEAMEFRYKGSDWTESNIFEGLEKGKEYFFEQRYKEDKLYSPSLESPHVGIVASKLDQDYAPKVYTDGIGKNYLYINGAKNVEVSIHGGNSKEWYDVPHRFDNLDKGQVYNIYFRMKETKTHNVGPENKDSFTTLYIDENAGPTRLSHGLKNNGYFGILESSDIISPADLSKECGITSGSLINNDVLWHKFSLGEKTLYVPEQPILSHISYSDLESKGLINGEKTISIRHMNLKIRLLKAYEDNSMEAKEKSEWSLLMYPLHKDTNGKNIDKERYANYNQFLTDKQMVIGDMVGGYSWCQESKDDEAVVCGSEGIQSRKFFNKDSKEDQFGWRPVLEIIEND